MSNSVPKCGQNGITEICSFIEILKQNIQSIILGPNSKYKIGGNPNNKIKNRLILLFGVILILSIIFIIYYNSINNYKNRSQKCMSIYNNNDYKVNMKKIPYNLKDYKLCDFYIASSYKSCLPCGNQNDVLSYDNLRNVLLKGARFIHLDIHYNNNEISEEENIDIYPVVVNMSEEARSIITNTTKKTNKLFGINTTDELDLYKCLNIINKTAWLNNNNYPLFLYLEIYSNNNIIVESKIADIVGSVFKYKLLDANYSFCKKNIGQEKINKLYNKVIIIGNKYPYESGKLNELMNIKLSNQGIFRNYLYINDNDKYHNDIYKIDDNKTNIDYLENIDKEDTILFNKENLFRSYIEEQTYSTNTLTKPKLQLKNPNPYKLWNYGFQFVCMNYQLYDNNMINYINMFKDYSFILKPKHLRLIYEPDHKPPIQDQKLSYKPQQTNIIDNNPPWIIANSGITNFKLAT